MSLRLHTDLKILAQLREGSKLYLHDGLLAISRPTMWDSVMRWTRGDCRSKSISAAQNTLFDAISALEHSMASGERAERLLSEIESALVGVRYMMSTYCTDVAARSILQTIIDTAQDRLAALET